MAEFNRKERDRQLRRSDILRAAEHIFALRGYHKATIRDIAKESQYAIGTVYIHFKDKKALYFALLEEKMKLILSIIDKQIGQEKDARKKLEIFVREGLAFFEKNQDFFRIFISQEDETTSEKRFFKSPVGLQMQKHTINLLKEAQEQGVVTKDIDVVQLDEVLSAILRTFVRRYMQEGRKNDKPNNLSTVVLRLFLEGAAAK